MKHYSADYQLESNSTNSLISIENYNYVIDKWSHLSFYDNNLNKTSINVSHTDFAAMYDFTVSAERLLKYNTNNNEYIAIVFDIDKFNDINELYGHTVGNELINHINATLKAYLKEPNLYCRINDENFAIFLENYKAIDIALLVIHLTESLTNLELEIQTKLSFGICKAGHSDYNIPSLCRRAFYAKSTIRGEYQQLADYNELVFDKKTVSGKIPV